MKRLVLIGGGPNHYHLIKSIAEKKWQKHQVVLVSQQKNIFDHTLIPHHLLGQVTLEQCQLDLWKACQRAGVETLSDQVILWDGEARQLELQKSGPIPYDELSVECLSELNLPSFQENSSQAIIPSRPGIEFIKRFQKFLLEVKLHCPRELRIVLSGTRLPTLQLALAMRSQLIPLCKNTEFVICSEGNSDFYGISSWSRKSLQKKLRTLGFQFIIDQSIERIQSHTLYFENHPALDFDVFVPGEHFRPQALFARLMSSNHRKIFVEPTLQLAKDPKVFVHGDCIRWVKGQFEYEFIDELEQREVLVKNLLRPSENTPLVSYRQRTYSPRELTIDPETGLQIFGPFIVEKRWNRTDRKRRALKRIELQRKVALNPNAQSSAYKLEQFECLHGRRPWESPSFRHQRKQEGSLQLTSLRGYDWWGHPTTSTPFLFQALILKAICQGLDPKSLRFSLVLPDKDPLWTQHLFQSTLLAIESQCKSHKIDFAGGDTLNGPYWSLALTLAGEKKPAPSPGKLFSANDYLVITRPLGFGILWSGRREATFQSQWIEQAIDTPIFPAQERFSEFLQEFNVSCAVPIEEWGFLYHCMEALPVDQQLVINFRKTPKWQGVDEILSLTPEPPSLQKNWQRIAPEVDFQRDKVSVQNTVLWDSRSHGSVALGIPAKSWKKAIDSLRKMGFTESTLMGCVRPRQTDKKVILSDWVVDKPPLSP